jgi:hypothetical protein
MGVIIVGQEAGVKGDHCQHRTKDYRPKFIGL